MYCFQRKYYDISAKEGILPTPVAKLWFCLLFLTQTELMYLWILLFSNYVPISACQCSKQCTLLESNATLFLVPPHSEEGNALVHIRPLSHTDCPMLAAGALACTGQITVVCVGMVVAAHPVAHALQVLPLPAPMGNASTGLWCSSSHASAVTSATI